MSIICYAKCKNFSTMQNFTRKNMTKCKKFDKI